MPNPNTYIHRLNPDNRPVLVRPNERVVADIAWYNRNRATARRFHPVDGIEGIVIHATAGGTAGGAISWWKDPRGQASAHWVVPSEIDADHGRSVIAVVYEALAAWHVRNDKSSPRVNGGRANVNHWTLGIEIVNTQTPTDT
jgi:N-acetyl-anhydromuramyl-L-alanine amidase AmpD